MPDAKLNTQTAAKRGNGKPEAGKSPPLPGGRYQSYGEDMTSIKVLLLQIRIEAGAVAKPVKK